MVGEGGDETELELLLATLCRDSDCMSATFRTSCRDDILPSGLGDLGNEGG